MSNIPTPHIEAKAGDFAETVLMPGDPLRARFIAENFLTDAKLVNNVRGIQGYTGTYKGKRVSVMASGMGMPSMAIYSYELFNFYDVKNIIRVGTAGVIDPSLKVRDVVIGMGACTNSNYAAQFDLPGTYAPICSYDLMKKAVEAAQRLGIEPSRQYILFRRILRRRGRPVEVAEDGSFSYRDGSCGSVYERSQSGQERLNHLHYIRQPVYGRSYHAGRKTENFHRNDGDSA